MVLIILSIFLTASCLKIFSSVVVISQGSPEKQHQSEIIHIKTDMQQGLFILFRGIYHKELALTITEAGKGQPARWTGRLEIQVKANVLI